MVVIVVFWRYRRTLFERDSKIIAASQFAIWWNSTQFHTN